MQIDFVMKRSLTKKYFFLKKERDILSEFNVTDNSKHLRYLACVLKIVFC